MKFNIKIMEDSEIESVSFGLQTQGIDRELEYFRSCMEEATLGDRVIFLARTERAIVGVSHLLMKSKYPQFRKENIPEINDLRRRSFNERTRCRKPAA